MLGVTRDVAHVRKRPGDPRVRTNRRRPVTSVAELSLSSGHMLKPWQAGQLLRDGLIHIEGMHAVENELATGGVYLRSDPDDTTANNVLA